MFQAMKKYVTLCTMMVWVAAKANLIGLVWADCPSDPAQDCCHVMPVESPACCHRDTGVQPPHTALSQNCACQIQEAGEPETSFTREILPPGRRPHQPAMALLPAPFDFHLFRNPARQVSKLPNPGTHTAHYHCADLQIWRC